MSEENNGTPDTGDKIETQKQESTTEQSDQAQPVDHNSEKKTGPGHQPEEPKESHEAVTNEVKETATSESSKEAQKQSEDKDYLNKVAEDMVNEVFTEVVQTDIVGTEVSDKKENEHSDVKTEAKEKQSQGELDEEKAEKMCVITSKSDAATGPVASYTAAITETPEVSSTRNDEYPSDKPARSSRRGSYVSNRGYAAGYQNYGLTHLPYKSNFEPSEEARRRADEFFKTFKL